MSDEQFFKKKITLIDRRLNDCRQLLQETTEMLKHIRDQRMSFSNIENNRLKMNQFIKQLPEEIDELERISLGEDEFAYIVRSRISEKRKETTVIIKNMRELLSQINVELTNRRNSRNKESSIINAALEDYESSEGNYNHGRQKQQFANDLDDKELQISLEEERQCAQIAKNLVDLENMFTDIATQIHNQGEQVDSIVNHVGEAYKYVESGEKQLNSAVGHKKSAFKKKGCLILVGIGALCLIALILGLSLGIK